MAPDRAVEKAKVKETIKQVKFYKSPSNAAKFYCHSCFFLKEICSLLPYPVHICKNNTSITHLWSMLEKSATPTHHWKKESNELHLHKDQLYYYSINLHVFTGVLVANQSVNILNYKMFLGDTDFTLFITICQSCNGYHQKQLLCFPFQAQSIFRSLEMCIVLALKMENLICVFDT